MNSWWRWRCMQRPMTLPSSTLRAANRVEVGEVVLRDVRYFADLLPAGGALLPAPDAGLRLAGPAHDPIADAISAVQYDPCAPNMLLGDVARPTGELGP